MKLISVKTILGLSGLLLMAACTNELVDSAADGARAISFTSSAETRAAVEGNALPADFKVWGGYDGNATNVFNGVIVQHPNWTYTGGTQYWIPGKTYNFYGVYPASVNASCASDGTLTVSGFDCSKTGDEAVDLMTASQTGISYAAGVTPKPVSMQFGHELARVKFTVESVRHSVILTEVFFYGINYVGTFKSPNQWLDLSEATIDNTPFEKKNVELTETNLSQDLFGDILLIPHTDLTNAKLSISYKYVGEDELHVSEASLRISTVSEWIKNSSYHYKVSIPANATDVSLTVSVDKWNTVDTSVEW